MILIRHAQSEFNASFAHGVDPGIRDPSLTAEGRRQAMLVAGALAGRGLRRIIASPYTRALQTAEIIADRLALPVAVDCLVAERMAWSCDVGSPRSQLIAAWPRFTFRAMAEQWWCDHEETETELIDRARRFHGMMRTPAARGGVAVVSHWGFIRAFAGVECRNGEILHVAPGETVEIVARHHPC